MIPKLACFVSLACALPAQVPGGHLVVTEVQLGMVARPGMLFLDPDTRNLNTKLELTTRPLNELDQHELCPGSRVLNSINEGLR